MAHQGTGRMGSLAAFSIIEGSLNLGLSLALVKSMGILGVAIGTAVPAALVHGLLLPWWNCRHYGMALPRYLLDVWTVPGLAALATFGVMRWVFDPEAQYGWVPLMTGAAGCALFFGLVAWRVMVWRAPAPSTEAAS